MKTTRRSTGNNKAKLAIVYCRTVKVHSTTKRCVTTLGCERNTFVSYENRLQNGAWLGYTTMRTPREKLCRERVEPKQLTAAHTTS